MHSRFTVVAVLLSAAVFALPSAVSAAVIQSGGAWNLNLTDPVPVGSVEGLVKATLQVINTTGIEANNPSTFNGQIGINGTLHQEQFANPAPPFGKIPTPTATSAGDSGVDSHFLTNGFLPVTAPTEPAVNETTSQEPGAFPTGLTGYGGPLSGNFALGTGANPSPATYNLAQLVWKSGTTIDYSFIIAAGVGDGASEPFQFAGTIGGGAPGDTTPPAIQALVRNITLGVNEGDLTGLQLTGTDDTTAAGNLVWSALTPVIDQGKNPAFPGATNPVMGANGVFNWNPNGWRGGEYTFNATVADEAGNTTSALALTVNLTVPEPATLSLLGLALVGFVGVARRRG